MATFLDVVQNFGDFAHQTRESMEMFGSGSHGGATENPSVEPGFGRSVRERRMAMEQRNRQAYERKMMEARRIIVNAFRGGDLARYVFKEALSTSDFPQLFGDVIDRSVLANYLETPYTWNLIARQAEVNDFRPVKRFRIDGGTGLLAGTDSSGNLIPLTQGAQYPEDYLTDDQYTYQLQKYGKRMPFFWGDFRQRRSQCPERHSGAVRPRGSSIRGVFRNKTFRGQFDALLERQQEHRQQCERR